MAIYKCRLGCGYETKNRNTFYGHEYKSKKKGACPPGRSKKKSEGTGRLSLANGHSHEPKLDLALVGVEERLSRGYKPGPPPQTVVLCYCPFCGNRLPNAHVRS